MLENYVHFLIPSVQRTDVSRAVVADTRGAAPFRVQQIVFDTAAGACADRGLYLLADSVPDLHGDRIHRAIQPITACAGVEHAWPDSQRQFDHATLGQLLADPDSKLGPPLDFSSPLLPRARLIHRGRRGLVRADDDKQTVIEINFQRCEFVTASHQRFEYRLSLHLLAGDIRTLFSHALLWQRRFGLIVEPQPFFVYAARLAADKQARPERFSTPVWSQGRLWPETVLYPAVSGSVLLAATASDLAMQVHAIAESVEGADDSTLTRLDVFEQDVQAVDCLLHFLTDPVNRQPSGLTLPAELTEHLRQMQDIRYEHLVQSRLAHWASEAGVASVSADQAVRAALGVGNDRALRAMATDSATHQWVLTLLAWCECCDDGRKLASDEHGAASGATPSESDQDTDRQRLERWVSQIQGSVDSARSPDFNARLSFWVRLHRLDEALTQFGAALPRRLLLRYRMNIRAVLVPLTDWLVLSRLLRSLLTLDPANSQVVKRSNWPLEHAMLVAAWQQQVGLGDQRVISQLTRLAQTAKPDDPQVMSIR